MSPSKQNYLLMKRPALFLLFFSFLAVFNTPDTAAQLWKMRRFEASAGIGPSFFFSDIGGFSKGENMLGFKDMSFLQTRYNINGNVKYRILEDLNLRLSLTAARLRATDQRGSNEGRNMESKVFIFEPAVIGEFYFIKNKNEDSYLFSKGQGFRRFTSSLDCYAFTGFGGASYSVKGNDELIKAGMETGGFTPVIPIGAGVNLIYSADFNFGVELGGRYSFSDNIEGYTSQYSSSNDVYYFLNFTFTYKMRAGRKGLPALR